jgi:hypothetical protein
MLQTECGSLGKPVHILQYMDGNTRAVCFVLTALLNEQYIRMLLVMRIPKLKLSSGFVKP